MSTSRRQTREIVSFGPFSLVASERLLTKGGAPVELSARALDILIALVSQPNQPLSKIDLLSKVWPDVTVEETSLRFHIARLRKALGDGIDGARYIITLAGRGYCFVGPVSRSSDRDSAAGAVTASFPHANLPGRLVHMVGRDEDVLRISDHLIAARFVSIVGGGGVGKTTVAIAVGHHLGESFAGAVLAVDLSMLSDPALVATAIASMLGLSVQSEDATPALIAHLRSKRMLLILDTCEHLIDAVASLTSQIYAEAPQVHILATSREVLQVEGEHVYRLDTLACPPEDSGDMSAAAQTFPAPRLFIERAAASGARLDLSDADVAIVVRICRKLDGVALAIELAARRVEAYGLRQTETLLDQHLALLLLRHRSATPRQKTLQATLDWSYQLLSELERVVLRRLAVFVGHFTLDAALAVVAGGDIDQSQAFGAIESLVGKSMIATRAIGAAMRYRLLDTTRAYLLNITIGDTEAADLAVRHVTYFHRWCEQSGGDWPTLSTGIERSAHFAALNNVRSALEWCFGERGDVQLGIKLAAAAAPVFLAMSLFAESHRWSERAILALDDDTRDGFEEMQLQAALGVSLIFTRGGREAARLALVRALAIAEDRGDVFEQVRVLEPLCMFHQRIGEYKTALEYAKRCSALARTTDNSVAMVIAHSALGLSFQAVGELSAARTELESAIARGSGSLGNAMIYLGIDATVLAGSFLVMNLWLQGYPVQAIERARRTMQEAASTGHAVSICAALLNAISVLLWTGDLASAGDHIDKLLSHAESFSLDPFRWIGSAFKGELAVRRGEPEGGVEALKSSIEKLRQARHNLFTSRLNIARVQGLVMMGRFAEAGTLVDETMQRIESNGDACYTPELLRVKGGLLLSMGRQSVDAEKCFLQSVELSRRQGARAWELRTAIELAALWVGQGRIDDARALLLPVFERFTEGSDTVDLKAAKGLLMTLS